MTQCDEICKAFRKDAHTLTTKLPVQYIARYHEFLMNTCRNNALLADVGRNRTYESHCGGGHVEAQPPVAAPRQAKLLVTGSRQRVCGQSQPNCSCFWSLCRRLCPSPKHLCSLQLQQGSSMQRSIALVLTVLALAAMPATQAQICTPIEAICTGEDRQAPSL